MRSIRAVTALALVALLAAVTAGAAASHHITRAASARSATSDTALYKIKHVVIIMQENHSFDNYFGTYPGADGIPGLAGHPGKIPCVPNPKTHHCVKPFHDRQDLNLGGPHHEDASIADINGGKMDGFVAQQQTAEAGCKCSSTPPNDVMGYHTIKELPNYWAYAHNFVLQDHMFEPNLSWSLPSHLYMVSAWSAFCRRQNDPLSCSSAPDRPALPPGWGKNHTAKVPNYAWTDLTYLLDKHHVSWRYYVFKGNEPDCESDAKLSCRPVSQGPRTYSIWNPLVYFDTVKNDHQLGNIQSLNSFFTAARKGSLPAVSWVVPNAKVSEHYPGLISPGQTYVTGLINLIMNSRQWDSTAIFLAWDDWSGFYDNAVPPKVDKNGYGLRVPALVISPYARRGYVDHQVLSFDAYIKFIEDDFLGSQRIDLGDGRPDSRPDVRENASQLGNLLNDFNFNQAPLKPVLLPVKPKTDFIEPR